MPSRDCEEFIGASNAHGVRYPIIGAHAVAHARPRATKDLDVLIDPTPANARKVLAALRDFFGGADIGYGEADLTDPRWIIQLGVARLHGVDVLCVPRPGAGGRRLSLRCSRDSASRGSTWTRSSCTAKCRHARGCGRPTAGPIARRCLFRMLLEQIAPLERSPTDQDVAKDGAFIEIGPQPAEKRFPPAVRCI